MDALVLSRLQFGLTAFFHFLFPPLTIGLSTIIAIMEFLYLRTDKEIYDRMARFWFKLFTIAFAVGVASGITLEFQFGTNWSEYSKFVGDIFGAPLAAEGVFAFFLESTFLGVLIFGRDKISRVMRFISSLCVAFGSTLSAFWIIIANSWQQTPTGYQIENGRAILTDFWAAAFNPSTIPRYLHTLDAAYITGAFFVMGISAYFLLRKQNEEMARTSLKIAYIFALIAVLGQVVLGDIHARQVAVTQPAKMAAFEAKWDTSSNAPLNLIALPDPANEKNLVEIGVPGLMSWLVYGNTQAQIQGLKDFDPQNRPPLMATYWSYRVMLISVGWLALLVVWGLFLMLRGRIYTDRKWLISILYTLPLPVLISEFGWMAAEIGRQPWIVYGLMRTQEAASPLPAYQILLTIVIITAMYSGLLAALIYLMRREINKTIDAESVVMAAPSISWNQ